MNTICKKTPRKSIPHLEKIDGKEFESMLFDDELFNKMKVTLKVDGAGIRFGRNREAAMFFEGSRTGPVYDPEEFIIWNAGKSEHLQMRGRGYAIMMRSILSRSFMCAIPPNFKIVGEALHYYLSKWSGAPSPDQSSLEDTVYVKVPYSNKLVNSDTLIVPHDIVYSDSGLPIPENDKKTILDYFYSGWGDNKKVRFFDPNIPFQPFDVDVARNLYSVDETSGLEIFKELLMQACEPHMGKLGAIDEGVVIHYNGSKYKIVTEEYKRL